MKVVSSWITHIWKYKILFLLGFFFLFFLSGYVGTTTFNYYCVQQKIPDYLRGGLFGFEHCIINTLTIDGITFWLSLFFVSFFFKYI